MSDRRNDSILRLPEVTKRTGLSAATIWRRIKAGTFPKAVKLGANSSGWYESDVGTWIADPTGWQAAA